MMSLYRIVSLRGKWLFIALTAFTTQVNAMVNQDSAALVTLKVNDTPIEDVLLRIEAQTGFSFTYSTQVINKKEKISVDFKREQLGDVLREVLGKRNLRWVIRGGGIVILKDVVQQKPPSESYFSPDSIPQVTIKGTVTGEEGFPLPGATIVVIGTNIGTTTDGQGRFILPIAKRSALIGISYTGYEAQEFNTKGAEVLVVKLKRTVGVLDEQVVIAYGTNSRRFLTGSIGSVTSKEIEKQPVSNVLSALQGRISGLAITQQTGLPGSNFNVQIRGQNSLRNTSAENGNTPFYIIDGVPFLSSPINIGGIGPLPNTSNNPSVGVSPLSSINPADIESIEILKDADATAIYGSRAANGVVLITTKKGKSGKMTVDANVYTGGGKVTRTMKLLNTQQYIEMRKEAFQNDGVPGYPAFANDVNGKWDQNRYTDWQTELIGGTSHTTDAQFSVYGGTQYTQYRMGGGFRKETTVFPGSSSDQRASAHLSLINTSANQKFKSQVSANYSFGSTNLPSLDLTALAMTLSPNAPALYNSTGDLNWENETFSNPLQYLKKPYRGVTKNLISNAILSYELITGLELKVSMGYTSTSFEENRKIPISSYSPGVRTLVQNTTIFGDSEFGSWIVEPQMSFRRTLGDGKLIFLLGTTFQNQNAEQTRQSASGFISEDLMDNIGAVPSSSVSSTYNYSNYRYNAIFGRINYNWKGKYLINLTARRDGSSRFGPSRQFANFGAIGAGWIFSETKLAKRLIRHLSYGKLRASLGTTGSDQIPNYQFLDGYSVSGQYQGTSALNPARLFNPDFRWEVKREMEAALETGFWGDRLLFTAIHYRNRSSNQLVGYTLPPTTGFTSIQYNLPATVQNTGWEIELKSTNIRLSKFVWKTSFNITFPKNELLEFPNLMTSASYSNRFRVGSPLNIFLSYKYQGVNSKTGLHEVEDVDKNGAYNQADMQTVNFMGQRLYGGLFNSLSYRNFSLDFLFQYAKQMGRNYLYSFSAPGSPGAGSNQPIIVMSRWQNEGEITSIQKFTASKFVSNYSLFQNSDEFVSDASYIRLKNVSLAYQIPAKILESIGIRSVRVYLSGQNLLTITRYKGVDPENQGIALPPLRVLTAGVYVSL